MRLARLAMAVVAATGLLTTAVAQELAPATVKVLGSFSNLNMSKSVERPLWTEIIPGQSGGKIRADFTTLDQMGLSGTEVLRLVRLGVVDFASGNLSYMAADSPIFDGLDLAGVFPDLDTLRKAVDAFEPTLAKLMQERYNAKLLMIWPAPPQVLYCRMPVGGMADLKGKKIRSFSPTTADFISGVEGAPVQITFPEVVPALQRGTVDCGVTGTLSGNTAKWWEVTTHLYPLVIGWAPWFHAVNLNTWNRLPPATRDFLEKRFAEAEKKFWDNAALEADQGIACNIGKPECAMGVKGSMTLVPVSDADRQKLRSIAQDIVLPRWKERCGKECAAVWSDTVGKSIGLAIK